MTVMKGVALFLSVALTGTSAKAGSAAGAAASAPKLTAISARVSGKGASLVIQASAPVPYVATRPDPLTVLVDFRNVGAEGVANSVAASDRSPIVGVAVEAADSMGSPMSRVRITLAQPVGYSVRSERSTIVLEFEKLSAKPAPYVLPPAARTAAPDAMKALEQRTGEAQAPADPIAALGLDNKPAGSELAALVAAAPRVTPAPAALPAQGQAPPTIPGQTLGPASDQPGSPRKYTGRPMSLDFQGADLRAVLRVFANESGLNIVIDPAVQGTVDVALRDVPWDQALDIILRANKLGYIVDGTIVRIAPLTVLSAEEKERGDLSEAQTMAGQLSTMTRQLSYAKGEEVVALLKSASIITKRGQAQVDARTNTIIVTDLPGQLVQVENLVNTLDKPQPQVEIEARIVQANKNYARALGIQWGFNGKVDPAIGNTTNLAFPNNGSLSGRVGPTQGAGTPSGGQPTGVNLPAQLPTPTSAIGLALGSVNGALGLDIALSAAELSGNARVLSTPRVSTQNNGEAEIVQGIQIPIQTVANNTITVTFKDAALSLKVTPQITAAGTVIMKIQLANEQADFARSVNGIPPINTQRANTTVLVADGQTTVIGGIYSSTENSSTDRTPGLGRVPLLGWLFRRDQLSNSSTELLIFITPKILKG